MASKTVSGDSSEYGASLFMSGNSTCRMLSLLWTNHAARMPAMRFPRPKSLSGLMLIGLTIVAAPLLFAIVNAAVQMNRLSTRSEQLVVHGVRVTRNNQRMFEEIGALERQARLYQIIGSADLLEVYARHHARLVTAI